MEFKSFIKNVSSSYVYIGVSVLLSFATTPFFLTHLSTAEYGMFAIASDLLVWLGLIPLGVVPAFAARSSHLFGAKDDSGLDTAFSTSTILQLVSGGVSFLGGTLICLLVSFETKISFAKIYLWLCVGKFSVDVIFGAYKSVLISMKKQYVVNQLKLVQFLIQNLLIIYLLLYDFKLLSFGLATVFCSILSGACLFIIVKRTVPKLQLSFSLFRRDTAKDLLKNGAWYTLGSLAGLFILKVDRFMVAHFESLEVVTLFVITGKLYFLGSRISKELFTITRPYIGQYFGSKNYDRMKDVFETSFLATFLLDGLMVCIFYFCNQWFISIWVGEEYYLGHEVNLFFAINTLVQGTIVPTRILLSVSLYKMGRQFSIRFLEGTLNLLLTIYFGMNYGVVGVLLASILCGVLVSCLMMNAMVLQFFKTFRPSKRLNLTLFLCYLLIVAFSLLGFFKVNLLISASTLGLIFLAIFLFLSKKLRKLGVYRAILSQLKPHSKP